MNIKTVQLLKNELVSKKSTLLGLHLRNKAIELDVEETPKDSIDRSDIEESWFAKERLSQHWKVELHQIELALQKIEQGSFGICEDCDDEIPVKRLRVRPDAAYCLNCQETAEREIAQGQRPSPTKLSSRATQILQ